MNDTDQTTDDAPLSKTQRKAAMQDLQAMGEELIALNKERLNQLALPDRLLDAVRDAQRITSHSALARQKQYIGKLMREIDTAPIADQLARWKGTHNEENARFHQLEKLRERLLSDDQALPAFITEHPQAEIQTLRNLIRNARKEAAANKPPKSSRELFKLLREICGY